MAIRGDEGHAQLVGSGQQGRQEGWTGCLGGSIRVKGIIILLVLLSVGDISIIG